MNFIITILILFIMLGTIIAIHEFGHFIAAKKSDVYVDEFALGMGPLIVKHKPRIVKPHILLGYFLLVDMYLWQRNMINHRR